MKLRDAVFWFWVFVFGPLLLAALSGDAQAHSAGADREPWQWLFGGLFVVFLAALIATAAYDIAGVLRSRRRRRHRNRLEAQSGS